MAAATYSGARELMLWAVRPRRSIFVTRATLRVTPALAWREVVEVVLVAIAIVTIALVDGHAQVARLAIEWVVVECVVKMIAAAPTQHDTHARVRPVHTLGSFAKDGGAHQRVCNDLLLCQQVFCVEFAFPLLAVIHACSIAA